MIFLNVFESIKHVFKILNRSNINNNKPWQIDPLKHSFDEGFHPSWATYPWSNSIAWAYVLAQMCSKWCLNASICLVTYSNEFKMSKSIINAYCFTQFGYQMLWAWPSLLVALGFKILQGKKNLCRCLLCLCNLFQWLC